MADKKTMPCVCGSTDLAEYSNGLYGTIECRSCGAKATALDTMAVKTWNEGTLNALRERTVEIERLRARVAELERPTDTEDVIREYFAPAQECSLRYSMQWNGHATISVYRCSTCGYSGEHDAHPGCKRAALEGKA